MRIGGTGGCLGLRCGSRGNAFYMQDFCFEGDMVSLATSAPMSTSELTYHQAVHPCLHTPPWISEVLRLAQTGHPGGALPCTLLAVVLLLAAFVAWDGGDATLWQPPPWPHHGPLKATWSKPNNVFWGSFVCRHNTAHPRPMGQAMHNRAATSV